MEIGRRELLTGIAASAAILSMPSAVRAGFVRQLHTNPSATGSARWRKYAVRHLPTGLTFWQEERPQPDWLYSLPDLLPSDTARAATLDPGFLLELRDDAALAAIHGRSYVTLELLDGTARTIFSPWFYTLSEPERRYAPAPPISAYKSFIAELPASRVRL